MYMKKIFLMVIATMAAISVNATDFTDMEPLKLTTPAMEPTLDYTATMTNRPELDVLLDDHAPWA